MFGPMLDPEHAFGRIPAVGRTRVRRRRIGLLGALGIVAGLWAGPVAHALDARDAPIPVVSRTYVVRPGDTLWAIADRMTRGADPRPLVDAIVAANGVDAGALVPGRTLVIPAVG